MRLKATFLVVGIWLFVSLCHWQPVFQCLIWALTALLAVQALRMLLAQPIVNAVRENQNWPIVAVFVPARNEQAVLPTIVANLAALDYPSLEIWVINDGSTDDSARILAQLQSEFPKLRVHDRPAQSGFKGGKSAALNAVLPLTHAEIMLICDADAQLAPDFLRRTVPLFAQANLGAVQVQKTIGNRASNLLTDCQQLEMSCDCWLQIRRTAIQGMSELRGNGMLVRRSHLEQVGGWNENTVTEDLDMTFRLSLLGVETAFVTSPAILEEGVTTGAQLWRQRRRWAEGGYQRYLDYWPQILGLSWSQRGDLLLFCLLQFLLPIGLIPDLLWTIGYSHHSVLLPLQMLLSSILTIALVAGLYEFQGDRGWQLIWGTIQGSTYMLHWIPIMILTTFQACVRDQPWAWQKSEHSG
jgi:1,2-diacylglycerol 3-beta-glucosyltransferase